MRHSRNLQHTKLFKKQELSKLFFKKILKEITLPTKETHNFYIYLGFFSRMGLPTRFNTACFLTEKSKSVFKKFKLNRISFRELALAGHLNGLSKSSW